MTPKRPADKKKNPKPDTNELGFRAIQIASGEIPNPDKLNDAQAVAAGRKGGLKGGKARFGLLSDAQKTRLGKKAARARWKPKD